MNAVIEAQGLTKEYPSGEGCDRVLREVGLTVRRGETCLLLGPSGSGKTTLLSILGCLLSPTAGTLAIAGDTVPFGDRAALAELRRTRIGFVFQNSRLLPFASAYDNVALAAANAGVPSAELDGRIHGLLTAVKMERHRDKRPAELSGGMRQRIALARALVHQPVLVLADEPTAALDRHTGRTVVDLLLEHSRSQAAGLIVVTHDEHLSDGFDRVIRLNEGALTEDAR